MTRVPPRSYSSSVGPGPASVLGTALPSGERSSRRQSRAGRRLGSSLPPRPRAFISSAPARPPARPPRRARLRAASTARRAWHPCYPTRWRTPPALLAGAGNSGPRPLPGVRPEKIPTPNSLGAAVRCARGGAGGQGELLPGGPGWSTKETLPRAWLRPQYPTRNGAPRGPSDFRFATADVRPQRPLGTVDRLGGAPGRRTSRGPGACRVGCPAVGYQGQLPAALASATRSALITLP